MAIHEMCDATVRSLVRELHRGDAPRSILLAGDLLEWSRNGYAPTCETFGELMSVLIARLGGALPVVDCHDPKGL